MKLKKAPVFISKEWHVRVQLDATDLHTRKRDQIAHGYGPGRMNNIVRKYNGSVSFPCTTRLFETMLMPGSPPENDECTNAIDFDL